MYGKMGKNTSKIVCLKLTSCLLNGSRSMVMRFLIWFVMLASGLNALCAVFTSAVIQNNSKNAILLLYLYRLLYGCQTRPVMNSICGYSARPTVAQKIKVVLFF